jgi:Fe-S-cluster-containing dehydrogenase component
VIILDQNFVVFDMDRCISCHACEVACKQENDLPMGVKRLRILTLGPVKTREQTRIVHVPKVCRHCNRPLCIVVCPQKAIVKKDGVVTVNSDKCDGCQDCVWACPYGAIQFNHEKGIIEKCDLCLHRLQKGLKPLCVQRCPTKALAYVSVNEITELVRAKAKISEGKLVIIFSRTSPSERTVLNFRKI